MRFLKKGKEWWYIKNNLTAKKIFHAILPLIIGTIVGIITSNSMDYNDLIKPMLSPPGIVFPIAWTIIYLLIGISYYLYRKKDYNKQTIKLYYTGLLFNSLWSIIFFVLKLRLISIIWIIALVILTILLFISYKKQNKISAYLLIPYLIWLIYATYINIGVYILN